MSTRSVSDLGAGLSDSPNTIQDLPILRATCLLVVFRRAAVINAWGLLQDLLIRGVVVPDPFHIDEVRVVDEPPQAVADRLPEIVEGIAEVCAAEAHVGVPDHRV